MKKVTYFICSLLLLVSSTAWAAIYTFHINSQNLHSFNYTFKLNEGDTVVAKINLPLGKIVSMTTFPMNHEAFCMTSAKVGHVCVKANKKWRVGFPVTDQPSTKMFVIMYTKGQDGTTFHFQSGSYIQ